MPRTESTKKRSIRFCGHCGYELARDNDGACPMCRRFEQLRLDFSVPRPSDAGGWPPTPAEYRALLAERRSRAAVTGHPIPTVIRTAAMRQAQVPHPPPDATMHSNVALPSPAIPKPSLNDLVSPSPKKAKARRGYNEGRRAARARARSSAAVDSTKPATASSLDLDAAGVAATPGSSAPSKAVGAQRLAAVATESGMSAMPARFARPSMQGVPERDRASRCRTGVPLSPGVTVAIVVLGVLVGIAASILLTLR